MQSQSVTDRFHAQNFRIPQQVELLRFEALNARAINAVSLGAVHSTQNISEPELSHRKREHVEEGQKGQRGNTMKDWVLSVCAIAWRSSAPFPYLGWLGNSHLYF
jgi:hypothetical protein